MKTFQFCRYTRYVVACISFATTLANAISGQPGTLDPDWNGTALGKAITAFGTSWAGANAIALQPDGKVVAVGGCEITPSGASKFCVARYNADGSMDATLGDNGRQWTVMSTGSSNDIARGVVIQSDGKMVLAGFCDVGGVNQFCMLRYTSSGLVHTNFGDSANGKVFAAIGSGASSAYSIAQQPDRKLVLAGRCSEGGASVFCAARYDADGTLDTTFGSNGKVTTLVNDSGYALAMTLQPDGRILLAGRCTSGTNVNICLVRYLSNGALDASFSGNGKLATDLSGNQDIAYALALQSDGKIVVAGGCITNPPQSSFCVARYDPDGGLDTSFDGNGMLATSFGNGASEAQAIAVQSDGKILVTGNCGQIFCAVRYNSDGSLDNTFGSNGKVATAVSGNDTAVHADEVGAMALQTDGKFVVAGRCTNGSYTNFCVIRYDGGPFGAQNCKLDIDGDGKVLAATDILMATRVALGMNGTAVVGGIAFATHASRQTWSSIRSYLVTQCNMSLP
jgi:uncharacterized delta-60 repeat protein